MFPPSVDATPHRRSPLLTEDQGPRIVVLGGGTGLPVLLRGLKSHRPTAIVTVGDDGGSSGRLRRDYGILPPGDIRNCLLALSRDEGTLADLFSYRFNGEGDLAGHNLGNLILTALAQMETRFDRAVEKAGEMLAVSGRVLPATAKAVGLVAEFEDGSELDGESRIAAAGQRIRRIRLEPSRPPALPQAVEAIRAADVVVIGPGSLFTSLIPVLLVAGLPEAIASSRARVVLVMNLMTEPGETDGLAAVDHLLALRNHAPLVRVDDVIVNDAPVPEPLRRRYAKEGAQPLAPQAEILRALGCRTWVGDVLAEGGRIRHDPGKLAAAVLDLFARPAQGTGAA